MDWCVVKNAAGQYGHFSEGDRKVGLLSEICCPSVMLIMQWCLPARRQHAGSRDSIFPLRAKRVDANGRPKMTSSATLMSFRNTFN